MSATRRPRHRRRTTLVVVTSTLITLVAGAAFAFWASVGLGSAAASTGTSAPLVLTPGTPGPQLYPGGRAAVTLTIANPNRATVRVGSLALDTTQGTQGFAVDAAHAGCGLSALSFATQSGSGPGWTVSGNGSLPLTLTGSLSMAASASSSCQGAGFTVYLRVAS
jgi:hypothetical protein